MYQKQFVISIETITASPLFFQPGRPGIGVIVWFDTKPVAGTFHQGLVVGSTPGATRVPQVFAVVERSFHIELDN